MKYPGEIFLSELVGKKVIETSGEIIGEIKDFIVVRGEFFPNIIGFVVKRKNRLLNLPWHQIELFNRNFTLCKLHPDEVEEITRETLDKETLAIRDIWDKQIVDINGAKLVRVNDIKVKEIDDRLSLIAVDVGFRGLLRRLGLKRKNGYFWKTMVRKIPYDLISWHFIQPIEPRVTQLSLTVPKELIAMHPSDIADILTQIPPDNQESLMNSLGIDKIAEAIPEMDEKSQIALMENMDTERAADVLEAMAPDDAADILIDLPEETAEEIIEEMEDEEAEDVKELMQHEEDTAGGLMTTDYLDIKSHITAAEALSFVRQNVEEYENIYVLYVIDDEERILGTVTLHDLFSNPEDTPVSQFMDRRVKSVDIDSGGMEAAKIMAKYNLLSLPVLDEDNKLSGIITVDDILELLIPSIKKRKRF
ncbi:MAG: magnesium transporter MgtE N-terminal domain-containing protein [Candidatus Omnitrophota bacterium]